MAKSQSSQSSQSRGWRLRGSCRSREIETAMTCENYPCGDPLPQSPLLLKKGVTLEGWRSRRQRDCANGAKEGIHDGEVTIFLERVWRGSTSQQAGPGKPDLGDRLQSFAAGADCWEAKASGRRRPPTLRGDEGRSVADFVMRPSIARGSVDATMPPGRHDRAPRWRREAAGSQSARRRRSWLAGWPRLAMLTQWRSSSS